MIIKHIAFTIFIFAGCTNNPSVRHASDPVSGETPIERSTGELIMIQSGGKAPLISKSGINYWIQQKDNQTQSSGKLSGLLATGDWQSAITEARRLLETNPGDEGLLTALGDAYAAGRNYEMAAYYGGLILKTEPGNSDAMNLIGLRLMMASANRRSDYDDAITWFRKALDSDGSHVAGGLNMGYLQLELGDAAAANETFALVAGRCQRCFDAQYGYGVAASRTSSWSNAKNAFESILSSDPSRAEAVYQLAIVYKNGLGDTARAIQLLQNLVNDADGRFKGAGDVKRVANVTLRRLKASDRSGPEPLDAIMPRGGEQPARAR
jgi:tetratricopeptide (TPR) repeat protein